MIDWRAHLRDVHGIVIHPNADQWPMLEEEALRRLGHDIVTNGLRQAIVVYTPDGMTSEPAAQHREKLLLDGRNRFAALALVLGQDEFAEHVEEILND